MEIAVVGGGPAGLRAAETAARAGCRVTIFDARPSVGRKFLVAGRGGLNLTHGEPLGSFARRYSGTAMPPKIWDALLHEFSPQAMQAWAHGLGIQTFQAKTGRIYPVEMKAAPLLRRWVAHLKSFGVQFTMQHRLTGLKTCNDEVMLEFSHPGGTTSRTFNAAILSLGGGSWPQTGSDGHWITMLAEHKIHIHPLTPANCGWECAWPTSVTEIAEGHPLKNIHVTADDVTVRGELLITRYGLEGGCIYQLGSVLRKMAKPSITIDFKPTFSVEALIQKWKPHGCDLFQSAGIAWKLSSSAMAVIHAFSTDVMRADVPTLASLAKQCMMPLSGPRPLAEAISTAGGVCWEELDASLMIKKLPGVFVAGEMIDWEAPTGGYLIQGCLATGTHAGAGAAVWVKENRDSLTQKSRPFGEISRSAD